MEQQMKKGRIISTLKLSLDKRLFAASAICSPPSGLSPSPYDDLIRKEGASTRFDPASSCTTTVEVSSSEALARGGRLPRRPHPASETKERDLAECEANSDRLVMGQEERCGRRRGEAGMDRGRRRPASKGRPRGGGAESSIMGKFGFWSVGESWKGNDWGWFCRGARCFFVRQRPDTWHFYQRC